MSRRVLPIFVLAAVAGIGAAFLVYTAVTRMQIAHQQATEAIVVAAANLELAETVTSQQVKLVAWPKDSVPIGAFKTAAEVEGRVVRSSIIAGEPILDAKLAPKLAGRGGIMPMLVAEGQRAVTIKVDDAVKESGFILPNSRVDVFASLPRAADSQDRIGKLILQDVLVLAAGQTVEMRDNKPVSVTTVTLSLTPDQAEGLALAQVDGKLFLGTRNLGDKRLVKTVGATREALLQIPAAKPPADNAEHKVIKAKREPKEKAEASASPPIEPLAVPKPETRTVFVQRAAATTEHVFVHESGDVWTEFKEGKK